MAQYKFTTHDRSKGGKATAAKKSPDPNLSYMQYLGIRGFQAFADKWFDGDLAIAGLALSKIGCFVTDPARWNGAWSLPSWFPQPLVRQLVERYSMSDDAIPF